VGGILSSFFSLSHIQVLEARGRTLLMRCCREGCRTILCAASTLAYHYIHRYTTDFHSSILTLSRKSGLSDADVGCSACKITPVPIKCLTFAELRHHAVLNRSHYCPANLSTNADIENPTRYRRRFWSSCFETQTRKPGL
jgi:hypothetical protein